MPTYLLTWKPTRSRWENIGESVRELHTKGFCDLRWSSGRSNRIEVGDRVFLLRQGSDHAGIIASGHALCEPYEDEHWDEDRPKETAIYIQARVDSLLNPDTTDILRREDLDFGSASLWNSQASGIVIPPPVAAELERRWAAHLTQLGQEPVLFPDEVPTPDLFFEGATRQVTVSIYERSPHARSKCIEHYGLRCSVCSFDFAAAYGELGRGFIHVHHLVPLCDIGRQYRLDPIAHLRPICPNCHAMIHRGKKTLTIEALRALHKQGLTNRCS